MTSKEKLALIKETWYDVDLTDEKYIDFDEEQTFNDLEKDLERLEAIDNAKPSEAIKSLESVYYSSQGYGDSKKHYEIVKQALLKAQEQDKILDILKRPLFYSERKKLGEEFIEWAKENNVSQNDLTNIITWCFCFKMKEWLDNE